MRRIIRPDPLNIDDRRRAKKIPCLAQAIRDTGAGQPGPGSWNRAIKGISVGRPFAHKFTVSGCVMVDPKSEIATSSSEVRDISGGSSTAVPSCCTLEGFVLEAGGHDGLAIESLDVGTCLIVCTCNSEYRLIVLDGLRRSVLAKGGLLLPDATRACLQGASVGGSFVRTGWIGVGLRLEILVDRKRIVTSRVRSVRVESIPPRHCGSNLPA